MASSAVIALLAVASLYVILVLTVFHRLCPIGNECYYIAVYLTRHAEKTARDVLAPAARSCTAFSEHLLRAGYGYANGLAAADVDGDGDIDITSADGQDRDSPPSIVGANLYLFRNDGQGAFSTETILRDLPGKGRQSLIERHDLGDLDGDGDVDLAAISFVPGRIYVLDNPVHHAVWPADLVSDALHGPVNLRLWDVDGDGDNDIVVGGYFYFDGGYIWLENILGDRWQRHDIKAPSLDLRDSRTIEPADIDGDGDLDFYGSTIGGSRLLWFENLGRGHAWSAHPIDVLGHPSYGHAADMDGDGDRDLIIGHDGGISWYERRLLDLPSSAPKGAPERARLDLVRHDIPGSAPYYDRKWGETRAADLDGDGDMDIVATLSAYRSPIGGAVILFERRASVWVRTVIKEDWGTANALVVADFDGDGRSDIAASTERPHNEVRLWLNRGRRPGCP